MKKLPQAVSIFILPPSPQVLERRLRNRSQAEGVHDEAVIAARLNQARQELLHLDSYKYALVNDVLDQAATELRAIVLDARGENGQESALAASCSTAEMNPRLSAALQSFGVAEVSGGKPGA
jgi:guanylate kinase